MADEKRREIKTDDLVDRILRKDTRPGEVVKLVGKFLGNADRDDSFRLYLTEDLDHYLEFPKEATLEAERFPSGRLVVWIKAGTKVQDMRAAVASEDFLRGAIQQGSAGRAAGVQGVRTFMTGAAAESSGCVGSCSRNGECPGPQCW